MWFTLLPPKLATVSIVSFCLVLCGLFDFLTLTTVFLLSIFRRAQLSSG